MSKSRGEVNEEEIDEEEQSIDSNIKDGINDLMNLPIETLRDELKKRNFHPGVVDKMEKWFLASMLRDEAIDNRTHVSYGMREHGGMSGPIFSHNEKKEEEEESNEKQDEKSEKEEPAFNPNDFVESEEDQFPNSSLIKENSSTITPVRYGTKTLQPRQSTKSNPWARAFYSSQSLDKLVPIEVLEALPEATKLLIQQKIQNGTDFEQIIFDFLIQNSTPQTL